MSSSLSTSSSDVWWACFGPVLGVLLALPLRKDATVMPNLINKCLVFVSCKTKLLKVLLRFLLLRLFRMNRVCQHRQSTQTVNTDNQHRQSTHSDNADSEHRGQKTVNTDNNRQQQTTTDSEHRGQETVNTDNNRQQQTTTDSEHRQSTQTTTDNNRQ